VLTHPIYTVVYALTLFQRSFRFTAHFSTEAEVTDLLRSGKSIIRFGDGEINLLLGLRNHYHPFSSKLQGMLRDIVAKYRKTSPYLLSIPRFVNVSNDELRAIGKLNVWMPLKVMFLLCFPKRMPYMDAHNFYYDGYFERVIVPVIADKSVILITNAATIHKQKNNPRFPWKAASFVETPEADSLIASDEIRHSVDMALSGLRHEDAVLLFALGPVGKHMVKEYAEKGYQSLDIGKVAEVMFTDESIEWMI
jgi:hypothetical protein